MKVKRQHHFWTTEEVRVIKRNLHLTDRELGQMLFKTYTSVRAMRKRYVLIKAHRGHFPKGCMAWNKGKRYNPGGRSIETRFKKGNIPANAFRKVGDIFFIPDKGKNYPFIKLEHHRQYPYQRYVWEQAYGVKLNNDEIVRFKDGNPENIILSNLIKVSRAENVKMNLNRKKAAEGLKKAWLVAKTWNDYGYKKSWFKNKRKAA